jgi:signal recognition particle subunit SRP54
MLVGLQGAGKTTTTVKLAKYLKEKKSKNPIVVGVDFNRPAALEQLSILSKENNINVFESESKRISRVVKDALNFAEKNSNDVLIIDTAGRLHIDKELMSELKDLKKGFNPSEILLVVDSMVGKESVNIANEFNNLLDINGFILSKMDSDVKGGAALSLFSATKKPIKFIGLGEKADALELFYPDRIASRILDLGDILTLIEKAENSFSEKEKERLEKKIRKNTFDIEDFLTQIKQIKKMGSLDSIISMIPGISGLTSKIKNMAPAEEEFKKIEAIINSMTKKERSEPSIINGSRRKRIAIGSGTSINDVNKFLKQFDNMKKMMKYLPKTGMPGIFK